MLPVYEACAKLVQEFSHIEAGVEYMKKQKSVLAGEIESMTLQHQALKETCRRYKQTVEP